MSTPTHRIITTDSQYHDDNRPVLVQIFSSEGAAERALKEADLEDYDEESLEVMHLGRFEEIRNEWYLDEEGDLTFVGEETYFDMLCILPPEHHKETGTFGRFCMSERQSGPITRQYARIRRVHAPDICAWRHVNADDKSTWITPEELREHAPKAVPA